MDTEYISLSSGGPTPRADDEVKKEAIDIDDDGGIGGGGSTFPLNRALICLCIEFLSRSIILSSDHQSHPSIQLKRDQREGGDQRTDKGSMCGHRYWYLCVLSVSAYVGHSKSARLNIGCR